MATGKLDVEMEVKSPADKMWCTLMDSAVLFPKFFPDQYESIQVLEGDGKSDGSVRLIKYGPGSPLVKISKEKIVDVDEGNKTVSYLVVDGDLLNYYKNFKARLAILPNPNGQGSLVKWSCAFDKASDDIPDPNIIRDFAVKNFEEVDEYILTN